MVGGYKFYKVLNQHVDILKVRVLCRTDRGLVHLRKGELCLIIFKYLL